MKKNFFPTFRRGFEPVNPHLKYGPVWNHVSTATDKLTTANGGKFTLSSADLSSQSR